jgi:hypothetical protein
MLIDKGGLCRLYYFWKVIMFLITQARVGYSHSEMMALHFAARELGWEVFPAPTTWRMDEEFIASKPIGVPYGCQLFAEIISQQLGWTLLGNPFDWLTKIPIEFTKRKIIFTTTGQAKFYPERKFIKPADAKMFPAKIYEAGTFDYTSNVDPKYSELVADDSPTLISDVVEFTSEFRCYVKNQKVQTWSCYIHDGVINHDENWRNPSIFDGLEPPDAFVNRMLETVHSEPSVIDVGIVPGLGWAIIESNQAWASGIYGCDPVESLLVMKESVGLIL